MFHVRSRYSRIIFIFHAHVAPVIMTFWQPRSSRYLFCIFISCSGGISQYNKTKYLRLRSAAKRSEQTRGGLNDNLIFCFGFDRSSRSHDLCLSICPSGEVLSKKTKKKCDSCFDTFLSVCLKNLDNALDLELLPPIGPELLFISLFPLVFV